MCHRMIGPRRSSDERDGAAAGAGVCFCACAAGTVVNNTSHTARTELAMTSGRVETIVHLPGELDDGLSIVCIGPPVALLRSTEQSILHRPSVYASRVSRTWTVPGYGGPGTRGGSLIRTP